MDILDVLVALAAIYLGLGITSEALNLNDRLRAPAAYTRKVGERLITDAHIIADGDEARTALQVIGTALVDGKDIDAAALGATVRDIIRTEPAPVPTAEAMFPVKPLMDGGKRRARRGSRRA